MAASVLYGGAEMRLLKGAFTGIRKIPTLLNFAKKPLRETHNIVKATSHHAPLKQIFEQAKSSEKVVAKGGGVPCLDTLSKAGQVIDRNGLTKAGRALDKHGNRPNSPFSKATGNEISKNNQGQFHLDDVLTHPNRKVIIIFLGSRCTCL